MEKTVNTAWYAKKCALGTLVCCGTELVLLMLASALILRGAISEEMANGAVLVCAAVAAFLGCMIGARKTSKRAMMTAGCAASAWVTMQVIGFFVYDGLTPERSLELAAAMAVGIAVCYAFGTAWFMALYARAEKSITLAGALSLCVVPYLLPDLVKVVFAAALVAKLKKYMKI